MHPRPSKMLCGIPVLLAMVLFGCESGGGLHSGGAPAARNGALRAGRAFLHSRQQPDGSWATAPRGFEGGSTALATWALLESGSSATQENVAAALDWLTALRTDKTYTVSVRANAYRAAAAAGADAYRPSLTAEVRRLVANSMNGAYSYVVAPQVVDIGDQSNSHYAAMGVQAGAAEGVEIPDQYWRQVMRYWLETQNPDGGWPYSQHGTPSTATMTAAAIATLGLCRRELGEEPAGLAGAIDRGLAWLAPRFESSLRESSVTYYYFLTLERMVRLTGRRRVGGVDVAEAMVAELLRRQRDDGGWDGSWGRDVSTAYAVLVLSRRK